MSGYVSALTMTRGSGLPWENPSELAWGSGLPWENLSEMAWGTALAFAVERGPRKSRRSSHTDPIYCSQLI